MTTSTEAAQILRDHLLAALLDGLGPTVVADVQVLAPTERLTDLGAHAALVVHLNNGERFGMEVCPFPRPPVFPTANLRVARVPDDAAGGGQ